MSNLVIVDDHPIFLDGLAHFLKANGHEVLGLARNIEDAIALINRKNPDIAILDVSMKDGGGLAILSELRAAGNTVPAIFLTVNIPPEQTLEAVEMGVNGIVLKERDPEELLTCIARIEAGENAIDPGIMNDALHYSIMAKTHRPSLADHLTEREREISGLIRAGLRNRVIAEKCGLTEGTVKVHLHSIFQKLGVKSRAELIVSMMPAGGQ
ncbi:response regulator transcription factor [Sphingobium aquiterrae]|uniref:response regulator transcription factor n=1 Tax=Sphingobium aquiterrae TaxID=2038656 RepID=UPI003016640B